MSFLESIGHIMTETDLKDLLVMLPENTVLHMLSGKEIVQCDSYCSRYNYLISIT